MVSVNAWGSDDPAQVAKGGTGVATTTAYAVQCGGTTATGVHQAIAGLGSSGEVLTSNGAGALPTMQVVSGGGAGMAFISSVTASSDAEIVFTSGIDGTYNTYCFIFDHILPASASAMWCQTSTDGGTGYDSGGTDYGFNGTITTTAAFTHLTSAGLSTIRLANTYGNSANTDGASGYIYLFSPSTTTETRLYSNLYVQSSGTAPTTFDSWAWRKSAADVDAIRFYMQVGNIASGTISMYGMTTPA